MLAVFALTGLPSTLPCCHTAVKATICDMLLNHKNLGTDTLLPIQFDESCKGSLDSLPQGVCGLKVPCILCCCWPSCIPACPAVLFSLESGKCLLYLLVLVRHCSHQPLSRSFVTSFTRPLHITCEYRDSSLDLLALMCCPLMTDNMVTSIFRHSGTPAALP